MDGRRVSVIIPVYNAAAYLAQCMDALLDQTYEDFEIILVDDGSTDRSDEICDEYRKKDERVSVIHQANSGPGAARNAGLRRAKGEYICFVDSDDYVSRDYLRVLTERLEDSDADLVCCAIAEAPEALDTRESREAQLFGEPVVENVFGKDRIDGYFCNKIFRRPLIEAHGLRISEEISIWEDMLFFVDYIRHAGSVLFIPERLYYYRRHEGQLTSDERGKSMEQVIQLVKAARLFLARAGDCGEVYERWAHDLLIRNEITCIYAMLRSDASFLPKAETELISARDAVKKRPTPLVYRLKLWILARMAQAKKWTIKQRKHG